MNEAKHSVEPALGRYLARIARFPMLGQQEENALARRYHEDADEAAAHRLVTSHLRLVVKIAFGYRGYGLPVADLISEGELGMLKALKRYEPARGIRFASYAQWSIRAQIQEYVLHSWSLVKIGTTEGQKKLFFSLRRLKAQLGEIDGASLSPENAQLIATKLEVRETDVLQMNGRLSAADYSLNSPYADGTDEWQDHLSDDRENHEIVLARRDEARRRNKLLGMALSQLNGRDREIIRDRYLREKRIPCGVVANRLGITPQRVRQIELRALAKLRRLVNKIERDPCARAPNIPGSVSAIGRAPEFTKGPSVTSLSP